MNFLFIVIEFLITFVCFFVVLAIVGNWYFVGSIYKGAKSDHFDGERFFSMANPETRKEKRQMSFLKWLFTMQKNTWTNRTVEPTKPLERVYGNKIAATFINHATVLLQTEGLNILTDPVWSMRVSPVQFFGPKRHQNPGVLLQDLPPIDIILLSHNHYDHLDIAALRAITKRDLPTVVTHLGVSQYLQKKGIQNSIDMDWWDTQNTTKGVKITSVPAQHFSARALSDRNKTLWGGFVVHFVQGDVYFAGDTGYGSFVEKIKEKFPRGFRFALLPIGAFSPRWFMKEMHMSPDDAYTMKQELGIQNALAIHFGTFKLAGDTQDEPVTLLRQITEKNNDTTFVALKNGESLLV